jgi:hypothetical protein
MEIDVRGHRCVYELTGSGPYAARFPDWCR